MNEDLPDALHETRIRDCYERWLDGAAEWPELVALINARSPAQVERMEMEKGLR